MVIAATDITKIVLQILNESLHLSSDERLRFIDAELATAQKEGNYRPRIDELLPQALESIVSNEYAKFRSPLNIDFDGNVFAAHTMLQSICTEFTGLTAKGAALLGK